MELPNLLSNARGYIPDTLLTNEPAEDSPARVNHWLNDKQLIDSLNGGEQPHYALFNGDFGVTIWKNGDRDGHYFPDDDYQSVLLVTDERVLIAIGQNEGDAGFALTHDSITSVDFNHNYHRYKFKIKTATRLVEFGVRAGLRDEAMDARRYLQQKVFAERGEGAISTVNVQNRWTSEDLFRLSPQEFEILVAQLWERKGFSTSVTQASRDAGIDVIAETGSERVLIQAKRYELTNKVGIATVQRSAGLLVDAQLDPSKVVIVTSSGFTTDALARAKQTARLNVIDHTTLLDELNGMNVPKTVAE